MIKLGKKGKNRTFIKTLELCNYVKPLINHHLMFRIYCDKDMNVVIKCGPNFKSMDIK